MAAAEKWFHECIEAAVSRSLRAEQPERIHSAGLTVIPRLLQAYRRVRTTLESARSALQPRS